MKCRRKKTASAWRQKQPSVEAALQDHWAQFPMKAEDQGIIHQRNLKLQGFGVCNPKTRHSGIDYFELRVLEKQPMQEGHSDPSPPS